MLATIQSLMNGKKMEELSAYLHEVKPVDIALAIDGLEGEELITVFRILPKDVAAEVFAHLDPDVQERVIDSIQDIEMKNIIDRLFLDDMVDFIEEMPANIVKRVLRNISPERREKINQFLKYKDDSAGSIMTIEFVDLKEGMTLKQAIEHTRKVGLNKETINTCFIIDQSRHLKGVLSVRDLIVNDENTLVADVMDTNIIKVQTGEDQESIANMFRTYDLLSMPVVDRENRLVGIITIDDIVDVIERENTEDFHKMAGIRPTEESYLKTGVLTLVKKRTPWLVALLVTAMVTGGIIEAFEDVLAEVVVLAFFIPLLMATGGNAGTQSVSMVIRSLALGEITTKDYLKIAFKEARVAIISATILVAVNLFRMVFMPGADQLVVITVTTALFSTVVIANVIGGLLPLLAKKIKVDPAVISGPLLTSIADALALFIYFSMATWLIGL